jgi:hypothetical protein
VIVSLWPDLDALSDQDATDAGGCAVAQNAEIIQASTVEIAPGQLLRLDRDRDRPPWKPFNHLPVPTASPPRQQYAGAGSGCWLDLCDHQVGGPEARAETDHAKVDQVRMARDVAAMFDELKALADKHAELHADRARLQAELEKARAELARARQPWLRRLLGRRS